MLAGGRDRRALTSFAGMPDHLKVQCYCFTPGRRIGPFRTLDSGIHIPNRYLVSSPRSHKAQLLARSAVLPNQDIVSE